MTERWPDLAGRIEGKVHVLPIRVYYEDTDFSGAVYHATSRGDRRKPIARDDIDRALFLDIVG